MDQAETEAAAYQAERDKAYKELEDAEKSTPARGSDGKFVPKTEEPVKVEPAKADEPAEVVKEAEKPDPLAEMRAEVDRLKKVAEDNKAWGTRNAQELAELRREREQQTRQAQRPKILDANPELEAAVRYVAQDPAPRQETERRADQWNQVVASVHPGIFDPSLDPELLTALQAKKQALGQQWDDPLVAIREITNEKLAHAQRQSDKRFAAESANRAAKSAMGVPGAGAGGARSPSTDADAVARIRNMSDADFEKERRRVLGY